MCKCLQYIALTPSPSRSSSVFLGQLDKCFDSPSTHNKQSHLVFAADKYSNDFNTVGFVVIGVVPTTVHVTQCGMFSVMLHVINTTYLHTRNKKQQSIDNDNDLSLNCIPKIACKASKLHRNDKKSKETTTSTTKNRCFSFTENSHFVFDVSVSMFCRLSCGATRHTNLTSTIIL